MTPRRTTSGGFEALVKVSSKIQKEYKAQLVDPWRGSPFTWIRTRPSRTRGAIGEKLVAGWSAANGFEVFRTGDSEADRVIHGHRVEIKFSTRWKSGVYKFQQIRNQNYDYCLCLGISPFEAHAWLIPKSIILKHVIGKMGQHTGASGADTAWLSFKVGEEHKWMKPHGGSLAKVKAIFRKAGKGPHVARPPKGKRKPS